MNNLELEETCDVELNARITISKAFMTGQPVAECAGCKFVSVLWECACDLEHNCPDYQN